MTIDSFQDKIMQLRPSNFMGLNGAAAGIVGAIDSGANAVLDLQRACIAFVRAYKTNNSATDVAAARKELVAKIMVAHTFDAIAESQADELLEILQTFKKERE